MLCDGGVTDYHEVTGAGGEAVDGAVLEHQLEEGQEEGASEEVGDVLQLGVGDGDAGIVAAAEGEGAHEGGQPVGADPRAIGGGVVRVVLGRGCGDGMGFSSDDERTAKGHGRAAGG